MSDTVQANLVEKRITEPNEIDDVDLDLEIGSDAEGQGVNGSSLAAVKLSSKKKEALSQVPCKFFRSNGCSAGNSCPFAHIMPGEGQGKAVCQWFLKGSCRFGHKCALAHILPGQPMSVRDEFEIRESKEEVVQWTDMIKILLQMDRKNKRAAQHQQQNQNPITNGQAGQNQLQSHQQEQPQHQQQRRTYEQMQLSNRSSFRNPSSSGSRGLDLISGGQQMGWDESVASSRNTLPTMTHQHREGDLLFGVPDDLQSMNLNQGSSGADVPAQPIIGSYRSDWRTRLSQQGEEGDPSSLRRTNDNNNNYDVLGMSAAVGSPMATHAFGTSPFSHPGSHSVFYSHDSSSSRLDDESKQSNNREDRSRSQTARPGDSWPMAIGGEANTNAEINEEDFVPSSLSDLLTPAELQRRGRSNGLGATQTPPISSLTAQSMPARTAGNSSLWDDSGLQEKRWGTEESNGWMRDSEAESNARERFARDRAAAAVSTATSSSHLHPFLQPSTSSNLSVSNVSAGFLGSRLRRGLSNGQGEGGGAGGAGEPSITRPMDSYSPSAHAALSHAPGQSLPQGLAAGLSRLHLRADNNYINNEGGRPGRLQDEVRSNSSTSIWNHQGNGGVIGTYSKGSLGINHNDELGPTAPSSIFAHKTHMHPFAMARSLGGSASTSFDALHSSNSINNNHHHNEGGGGTSSLSTSINGSGIVTSPYARSPAQRAERGIAIPLGNSESMTTGAGVTSSLGSSNISSNNKALPSSSHMNRLRTSVAVTGSPLALPTTGEEVEEPMFELE